MLWHLPLPSGFSSSQTNQIRFLRRALVNAIYIWCYINNRIMTNPVRFAETHVLRPSVPFDRFAFPQPFNRWMTHLESISHFYVHLLPRLYPPRHAMSSEIIAFRYTPKIPLPRR